MLELVPLASLPPEVVTALLEQGGPTVAVVAVLWYRISKLEEHLKSRIQRIDDDVSANSSLIYDRLLGPKGGYPKPEDAPDRDGAAVDPPHVRGD